MSIRPIKTEEEYRATLGEIESLMRAVPGSPEGERLDVLVTLVEAYEQSTSAVEASWGTLPLDPEQVLEILREEDGLFDS